MYGQRCTVLSNSKFLCRTIPYGWGALGFLKIKHPVSSRALFIKDVWALSNPLHTFNSIYFSFQLIFTSRLQTGPCSSQERKFSRFSIKPIGMFFESVKKRSIMFLEKGCSILFRRSLVHTGHVFTLLCWLVGNVWQPLVLKVVRTLTVWVIHSETSF